MHRIAKERFDLFNSRYKDRHGEDFLKPGVHKVRISELQPFENKWSSIRDFLESSANPKAKEF